MSDFTKLHRFERVPKLNGASAKARAVWSMAHNALDRRGQMELGGTEWRAVLCRRLGIDPKERQWFHAGLRELETVGLISVQNDVFTLLGHAGADESTRDLAPTYSSPTRGLGAISERPRSDLPPTYTPPRSDLRETSEQPTAKLPAVTAENHSGTAPRARVQNREEESRSEESESGRGPLRDTVGDFVESNQAITAEETRTLDRVVATFSSAWKLATGVFPGLVAKRERERSRGILAWAREQSPEDPFAAIGCAAAAAAADPNCREAGKPFAMFASSPGTYFAKTFGRAPAVPSPVDELETQLAAALEARERLFDQPGQTERAEAVECLRTALRRAKRAS